MSDYDEQDPNDFEPEDDFDGDSSEDTPDDFDLPVIPVLPDDEDTEAFAFHAPTPTAPDVAPDVDEYFSLPDLMPDDVPALDDLDIEAVLASVATLSDSIAEQEAQEQAERAREDEKRRLAEEEAAKRAAYYLPRPPMTRVQRGSLASVIPAFMLMALGAGLTLIFSAPDVALTFSAVILMGLGAGAVLMVGQWLSSGRWATGALFIGLTILACIGVTVYLVNGETLGAAGWPLLVSAIGLAVIVSTALSQAVNRWQAFVGVALIVAGGVGTVVTADLVKVDFAAWVPILGAALGVSAFLLLVAPVFARK